MTEYDLFNLEHKQVMEGMMEVRMESIDLFLHFQTTL